MQSRKSSSVKVFKVLHFWPTSGGLKLRFEQFVKFLESHGETIVLCSARDTLAHLLEDSFVWRCDCSIVIFTSVMAPLVLSFRLIGGRARVVYMVRGDEISEALQRKRLIRASVAYLFQWVLWRVLKAQHIFVSWDLKELFVTRFGNGATFNVVPNTVGSPLPASRRFDGTVTVIGDFESIKNIEWILNELEGSEFRVVIYGNTSLPMRWRTNWITSKGVVADLQVHLCQSTLLAISSRSEGYPNIINEALVSGCAVVVHSGYPFEFFPLSSKWKFGCQRGCLLALLRKVHSDRIWTYDADNSELRTLVAKDWTSLMSSLL